MQNEGLEARVTALELRVHVAEAAALLALRLAFDDLSMRVSRGDIPLTEARWRLTFAAEQVGEGAPHVALGAMEIAQAYLTKLPLDPDS